MSKQLYFMDEDSETCHTKGTIIDMMKFEGLKEKKVFTAIPEKGTDHFWCTEFQEVGLKSEGGCGKDCEQYSPRNGKNGRCRFSKNCYVPAKEVTIKIK